MRDWLRAVSQGAGSAGALLLLSWVTGLSVTGANALLLHWHFQEERDWQASQAQRLGDRFEYLESNIKSLDCDLTAQACWVCDTESCSMFEARFLYTDQE
jgi:hypothetical protein